LDFLSKSLQAELQLARYDDYLRREPFLQGMLHLGDWSHQFFNIFVGVRDVFNKAMWLTDFRMIPAERLTPPPFTAGLGNLMIQTF